MASNITTRRFSVADYARLREVGILTEDDRVELIDGESRKRVRNSDRLTNPSASFRSCGLNGCPES
jgi:hypothetical protein